MGYFLTDEHVFYGTPCNMINGPLPDGTMRTYTFDARNRLTAVDGLTYSYDAENIRTQVTDSNGTTTYITDPHSSLSQVLSRTKDGQTTRYVYGVGLQYEVDVSGNAVYYHFDHVGNTAALTNDNETVIQKYLYSPYGSILYQENDYDTPFKFSGFFGVQTDRNGLVHMRARYYNPLIRRFINSDPARDAWNWFAYAGGNPISNVDPSGLDYVGTVQYRAGALIYGYGTFEGRLYNDANPTDVIDVSGSLHGMGFQGDYITGEQEIRINADTPEEALGNQGGFFLADAGFGAGPINIGGIGGSIGAHREDNNADFGNASGEIIRPGVSTGFDPTNPSSYLEKPRPGFGVSVGFFGTRVKEANRHEPYEGYFQPIPESSDYNFKTNIK